jgi:hypothetical protein
MTIIARLEREIIAQHTGIDRLIVDRSVEAFDALVDHQDRSTYETLMATAIAQMGYERPIRRQDHPTAVDRMKHIIIHCYARQWHITYPRARARIMEMMAE